jgi:hypothetical protein
MLEPPRVDHIVKLNKLLHHLVFAGFRKKDLIVATDVHGEKNTGDVLKLMNPLSPI